MLEHGFLRIKSDGCRHWLHPDVRISVLYETQEITAQVHAATAGKPEKLANEDRKALLSRLESESEANGDLSCESVANLSCRHNVIDNPDDIAYLK